MLGAQIALVHFPQCLRSHLFSLNCFDWNPVLSQRSACFLPSHIEMAMEKMMKNLPFSLFSYFAPIDEIQFIAASKEKTVLWRGMQNQPVNGHDGNVEKKKKKKKTSASS